MDATLNFAQERSVDVGVETEFLLRVTTRFSFLHEDSTEHRLDPLFIHAGRENVALEATGPRDISYGRYCAISEPYARTYGTPWRIVSPHAHNERWSSELPEVSHRDGRGIQEPEAALPSTPGHERHSLRRFIRRFVHLPWDVDDIVQEAYLRLLEHRPRGREPHEIPPYLFAIARNLVIDRKRRALRDARRRDSAFELAAQLDNTAPAPDELAFVDQASERLRVALNELPERARRVFLLHRFEGLRCESIAVLLGVTTRTVERDIAAALAHLKRALFAREKR